MRSTAPKLDIQPLETGLSYRNKAYAALKQAIMRADIYGQADEIRLDERQLAEALGVSRTPVREAMTLLEQEGFLRTEPRRGVFIVRKTRKQIVEMIEVWAALESLSARLGAKRAAAAEIVEVHKTMAEFEAEEPRQHIDDYSDANIAFHQAILRLGGSELVGQITENLFVHVRAIRRATIAQGDRAERSIHDHKLIIDALEARDGELAGRLVLEHGLGLAAHVASNTPFLD
jgi:DNA-binding GntR family transcriptional regulator